MSRESPAALPDLDMTGAEPLLRRLELTVRNKLDGLLQGNHLGLVPGAGSEAGDSRQYSAGDDVRRMDWPVTARTTVPHVRQTIVDRELETWLVVDLSPSVDFGTARTEKRELVLAAITAVVHLTVRGGNRVGAIVSNGEHTFRIPALAGTAHGRYLIRRVAGTPRAGANPNVNPSAGTGSNATPDTSGRRAELADLLERLRRPPQRRGLVAVVSDFLDAGDESTRKADSFVGASAARPWERPLRALAGRHQLLGIEVLDPRELELPAAGLVTFADPETGRELEVQTSDPRLRQRYAEAAAAQRSGIATSLRHAGAAHLQLRTDRDWLTDVVRFVVARRRSLAGATSGGVR